MFSPTVVGPLLESIHHRTGASGVYFYRFDRPAGAAFLEASAGITPGKAAAPLAGPGFALHMHRESPIVLHREAWSDARFRVFAEVRERRIEGVISIPLVHDGASAGLLNVYRAEPAAMPASELAALFGLSLPMGALLAAGEEYARLLGQLADRKVLERAKGILQARLAWTEEQAYLHLRRASRRRRVAMREIAREVIEHGPEELEFRHAS